MELRKEFNPADYPFIVVAPHRDGTKDIVIQDLTVKTPGENGRVLLDKVCLTLRQGSRVVLTGESGSGKTLCGKSIIGNWDHGSGLVLLPEGLEILPIPQQPYFSNTTLRGIMNKAPDHQCTIDDHELTKALQRVGLDQLVQHIPGQQVEILMDGLLANARKVAPGILEGSGCDDDKIEKLKAEIVSPLRSLVEQQFDVVQYVPDAQKELFKTRLSEIVAPLEAEVLADAVVTEIDRELARPLLNHLAKSVPDIAARQRGRFFAHGDAKTSAICRSFGKNLRHHLHRLIDNEDTDDTNRDVRLNKAQADFIAREMAGKLYVEIAGFEHGAIAEWAGKNAVPRLREAFTRSVGRGSAAVVNAITAAAGSAAKVAGEISRPLASLKVAFDTAAMPLRAASSHFGTKAAAREMVQAASYFMARQIVTGDDFNSSLSGGQRQKLLVAIGQLHNAGLYFLDELTAAMDQANGEKLYSELMDTLPKDAIVLSIAHNEYIWKYHTHHAHLHSKKIVVEDISAGRKPANEASPGDWSNEERAAFRKLAERHPELRVASPELAA